jgi:hypothetical protein
MARIWPHDSTPRQPWNPLDPRNTLQTMDATRLVRLRWRLTGAWLWPSFFALTLADAAIVHVLPLSGDYPESLVGAWLLGAIFSLIGIACLGGAVGGLVRRLRPDMPKSVARNYGGALVTLVVTLVLLAGGIIHHPVIVTDRAALEDAVARATGFIGDHAPAEFQANLGALVTFEVQEPLIYRSCVPNLAGDMQYCVVVDRSKPFGRSVIYGGSESNREFAQGT